MITTHKINDYYLIEWHNVKRPYTKVKVFFDGFLKWSSSLSSGRVLWENFGDRAAPIEIQKEVNDFVDRMLKLEAFQ